MAEYYIRTPDRDESRGPFTPEQLLTLVEAEQVDLDTLYYDDKREEWLPMGTNIELREKVFPKKESLKLKLDEPETPDKKTKKKAKKESAAKEKAKSTVTDMLATAEKESKTARHKRKQITSFRWATHLISNGLCLTMLLSAVTLLTPHLEVIKEVYSSQRMTLLLNHPLILLGIFDFLLCIFIYFGDRKLYPILRGRAMLTLGFGAYIGWALGDLNILLASVSFGIGIVWATLLKRFSITLLAVALSLAGGALLAYFSLSGHFDGLLDLISLELFIQE